MLMWSCIVDVEITQPLFLHWLPFDYVCTRHSGLDSGLCKVRQYYLPVDAGGKTVDTNGTKTAYTENGGFIYFLKNYVPMRTFKDLKKTLTWQIKCRAFLLSTKYIWTSRKKMNETWRLKTSLLLYALLYCRKLFLRRLTLKVFFKS